MKNEILGGMIGLCVGDALGVPVEFQDREERVLDPVVGIRGYGTYNQPPGTWSDDSSLALCLLDSLAGGLDYDDIMQRFLAWYEGGEYTPHGKAFDIGRTTRHAIQCFARGMEPLECGGASESDNGNGSLMRILPLVFYIDSVFGPVILDLEKVFGIIHDVSSLTHAHDRSKIACGIYIMVARALMRPDAGDADLHARIRPGTGKAKEFYEGKDEWAGELEHFSRVFDEGFAGLPEDGIRSGGYVVDTLEAALWCLLNTDSYESCVLRAINLGGDTDTTAAVAGGLAGIHYGYDAIPQEWVNRLARHDYIEGLCESFSNSLG